MKRNLGWLSLFFVASGVLAAGGAEWNQIGTEYRIGSAIVTDVCTFDGGSCTTLGASGAPTDATYITQTTNGSLSAEQALSALSTGIMRVATTTGVITSLTDSAGIASNISDETGTGVLVFGTAPTLTGVTLGGVMTGGDNNITGLGSVSFTQELDNGSKTTDFSVDFATDQKQKATLTANVITLTLDTTSVGVGNYLLKIVNGGLATLTWAAETGSIYFPGGTDPSLTAAGTDIVSCYFDGADFYCTGSLDFQ